MGPARADGRADQPLVVSDRQRLRKGATTARVRIAITGVTVITSTITNEAVHDLALAVGDDAYAIIEASNVIVARD